MPPPCRRIIRPTTSTTPLTPTTDPRTQRQLAMLRDRLDKARRDAERWRQKLTRAMNAWNKHVKAVLRLESRIRHMESS